MSSRNAGKKAQGRTTTVASKTKATSKGTAKATKSARGPVSQAKSTKTASSKKKDTSKAPATKRSSKAVVSKSSAKVTKKTEKKATVAKGSRKPSKLAVGKAGAAKKTASKASVSKKVVTKAAKPSVKLKRSAAAKPVKVTGKGKEAKAAVAKKASVSTSVKEAKKVADKGAAENAVDTKPKREFSRPSPSAVRRAKEKEKNTTKSPFTHTDHASIFKGVEARKAAAKAKQARLVSKQSKPKKGVARRLSDKQLVEFKDMLVRIRAELLRQIAYLRGASLQRFDEVNPEEDGTDAFERQLALKLAAGEGDSIFEIDEALERIQNTTYGVCEECNCIIPSQRLKALPFARRCVECQSRLEQGPSVSEHRYF